MATDDGSCSDLSDDDCPQLSGHALAALQEFYQEQKTIEVNESSSENTKNFQENWVCTSKSTGSILNTCSRACSTRT